MSERIPDLLVAVLAASIAVVSTVASATPCADLLWTRTDTEKVRAEPVWKLHALLREYRAAAATPLRHSRGDRGRVINLDRLEPVGDLVSAAPRQGRQPNSINVDDHRRSVEGATPRSVT
jgi:hypothetical protein